jgi:hypothetical protein
MLWAWYMPQVGGAFADAELEETDVALASAAMFRARSESSLGTDGFLSMRDAKDLSKLWGPVLNLSDFSESNMYTML